MIRVTLSLATALAAMTVGAPAVGTERPIHDPAEVDAVTIGAPDCGPKGRTRTRIRVEGGEGTSSTVLTAYIKRPHARAYRPVTVEPQATARTTVRVREGRPLQVVVRDDEGTEYASTRFVGYPC